MKRFGRAFQTTNRAKVRVYWTRGEDMAVANANWKQFVRDMQDKGRFPIHLEKVYPMRQL